ncbi:MAG: biotin/lipoyl-containing protein [Thermofilaceae archaeon]
MRRKFRVVLDGELYEVEVELAEPGDIEALLQAFQTGVVKRVTAEIPAAKMVEGGVPAPITGRVVEVRVKPGDEVKQGTLIAVMEAMKTRVEVRAGKSGIVKDVLVKEGATVKQGESLVVIV